MMDAGKSTQFYGLIIGFCIVAGGWAIGTISGGALNPAVALGIDVALRSEVNIELNFPPKLRGARSQLYRRRFL